MNTFTKREKLLIAGAIIGMGTIMIVSKGKQVKMAKEFVQVTCGLADKALMYNKLARELFDTTGPIIIEKIGKTSFNIVPYLTR